jgi:uncharacterized protein (TIGR02300 family)
MRGSRVAAIAFDILNNAWQTRRNQPIFLFRGLTPMSTKQARGTKRTCQNSGCGSRFYDLNHDPISCPVCGTNYVIASAPLMSDPVSERIVEPNKEFADTGALAPGDAPEVAAEELPEVDGAEEPVAAEEDETFLEEEEEDGGGVSDIIGGHGEDEEEV